jgi:hypothetical protein
MPIHSVARMLYFSFLYHLHWPINHQPFTMDNGMNTWACLLYVIHNHPLCFPARDKKHCTFLKCSGCRKRRKAPTFNLRSAPPSIETFPILDRWGKEERLQNLHTAVKVCICSQFPIPMNSISCCITISISITVLDLVVTVNELVVTVLDLVMKLVVDTIIDSFVTVLDLLVKD